MKPGDIYRSVRRQLMEDDAAPMPPRTPEQSLVSMGPYAGYKPAADPYVANQPSVPPGRGPAAVLGILGASQSDWQDLLAPQPDGA